MGTALRLLDTSSGAARELRGAARRIACFAASAHSATPVVAYASRAVWTPPPHAPGGHPGARRDAGGRRVARDHRAGVLARRTVPRGRVGGARRGLALRVAASGETLVKIDLRSAAAARRVRPVRRASRSGHARARRRAGASPGRHAARHGRDVPSQERHQAAAAGTRRKRADVRGVGPDGRVALGRRARRAFSSPTRTTWSVISPPESVRIAVRATLSAESPTRAVPPAGGAPRVGVRRHPGRCRASAFSAARVAVRASPTRTAPFLLAVRRARLAFGGGGTQRLEAGLCFRTPGEAGQDRGAGSQLAARRCWIAGVAATAVVRRTRRDDRRGRRLRRDRVPGREERHPGRGGPAVAAGARHAHHPRGRRRRPRAGRAERKRRGNRRRGRVCVAGPGAGGEQRSSSAAAATPDASDASAAASAASLGADAPALSSRRRRRSRTP